MTTRDVQLVLDPTARRRAEEEKLLHEANGPVLVDILGERAWAVADPDLLARLLADPRVSKDPRQHWPRFRAGEIVGKWPLYLQVSVDNMFTAYGSAHRRLRRLVAPAFTTRRLTALVPSVEENTAAMLDELDRGDPERTVDLRAAYAVQLPVRVISDFIGVPHDMRSRFKETIDRIWDTTLTPAEAKAATEDAYGLLAELIGLKRARPAGDMTSALIAARDEEGGEEPLTETELTDTLLLAVAAGYETTVNLIDSAITALLTDPRQLAHVREGRTSWSDVVEETLRFTAPVSHMPMRYAVEDIPLPGGMTIRQGEAILASYGAASNHPRHLGPSAGEFDATRSSKSHLAFGHGVHFCLGAPLARAEGAIALAGLFERFPALRLAVPAASLGPVPSILGNGHVALPVRLRP
jgi:cytochrome P450